jgi:hypothetical protein
MQLGRIIKKHYKILTVNLDDYKYPNTVKISIIFMALIVFVAVMYIARALLCRLFLPPLSPF